MTDSRLKVDALVLVLIAAGIATAGTGRWVQTTAGDFGSGEMTDIAVLASGRIQVAPETEQLLDQETPYVWCLAAAPDGTVYAGTGDEGRILKIDRRGRSRLFFQTNDLLVLSLLVGKDGTVYAGTGPAGTIYRIDPKGAGEVFYKGDDPYIWSLAAAPGGGLYAGTGDAGRLLEVSSKGKGKVLLDTRENHLVALGVDSDGTLYAATEGKGLVYKVDKAGKGFVLYEPSETEVRCLTVDQHGNVYVGTASGIKVSVPAPQRQPKKPPEQKKSGQGATVDTADTKGGAGEDDGGTEAAKPPMAPGEKIEATNGVYRIDPAGNVRQIFQKQGAAVFSLLATDGGLMVGTGSEGKIYVVDDADDAMLLLRNGDAQVTAMIEADGVRYFATGNAGHVFRVAAPHADKGSFTSTVHDAQFTAQWGRIRWRCDKPRGTKVTVATRTGNVKEPDDTWTDWSAELSDADGSPVRSAPARFIQYRLTLAAAKQKATPQVDEVVVSYRTANQPPRVAAVDVAAAKEPVVGQTAFGGQVKISWKAADPNGDELRCTVSFKGEAETTWKTLKADLTGDNHPWDTLAVPDGMYRVKVEASDSPANPADIALTGSRVSEAFGVDNTGPDVAKLAAKARKDGVAEVTATATDKLSGIRSARYSIDSGEWQALLPQDGVFDSLDEALRFTTDALAAGEHTLVIQVTDDAGNVGAGKEVFVVDR